jgi:hypothetical protein
MNDVTEKKKLTKLSPKELARYKCNDCGVNVVTIGEFYMLTPNIWERQLGLGWDDNLCIGCLEKRLGRKVSMNDMSSFPHYSWMQPTSIRLKHRLFGHAVIKRLPYRWRKSWLRNDAGNFTKAMAQAIGEYDERERAKRV